MVVGTTIKARMIERTKETRPSRRNCFRGIFLKDKCFALGCTNKRFETRNRLHRKIDEGDKIILSQNITEGHWIDIDNEYGNISEIDISGIKVTLYEFDDCIVAVWIQDQYAFNLTVYGEYNIELIIRMIEAIRLP